MINFKVHTSNGIETFKTDDFPCTIGRATDNTLVIDDPSVSSHHGIIEQLGDIYIYRDLGSTNGTVHKKAEVKELQLTKYTELHLGHISIDIKIIPDISENTVSIRRPASIANPFGNLSAWMVAAIIYASSLVLYFLMAKFMEPAFKSSTFISAEVGFAIFFAVIAAGLSVWSKFQNQKYRLWEILIVLIIAVGFSRILTVFVEFINFNTNSDAVSTAIGIVLWFAISFFMFYQLGKIIFPRTNVQKRAVVCTSVIAAFAGLGYGLQALQEERMPMVKIPGDIAYPIRSFSAENNSFQTLEKSIAKLNGEIEKQRIETLEKENKKN